MDNIAIIMFYIGMLLFQCTHLMLFSDLGITSNPIVFLSPTPNEQAIRASVRQACLVMNIPIVNASKSECNSLKETNTIGRRAPCAGIVLAQQMSQLLNAFGMYTMMLLFRICLLHSFIFIYFLFQYLQLTNQHL
jgi:hypothetical protein